MLIRLLPEQVESGWEIFCPMIVETLPPTLRVNLETRINILHAILREDAFVFIYKDKEQETKAFILASILVDVVAGQRYLLIYSFYGIVSLSSDDYQTGISELKTFAEARECTEVLAYVEDDRLVRKLQQYHIEKVTNLMRL